MEGVVAEELHVLGRGGYITAADEALSVFGSQSRAREWIR
jgi:hypothetical protein